MNRLEKACKNIIKLDRGYLLKQLFLDSKFKAFVIKQNQNQLALKGVDSKNKKLRSIYARFGNAYALSTINLKKDKEGLAAITDHVTLYDEGYFYGSFKLSFKDEKYYIEADTLKKDNDLQEIWGEDILGLTDESLQLVINLAIEIIIPIVLNRILNE